MQHARSSFQLHTRECNLYWKERGESGVTGGVPQLIKKGQPSVSSVEYYLSEYLQHQYQYNVKTQIKSERNLDPSIVWITVVDPVMIG